MNNKNQNENSKNLNRSTISRVNQNNPTNINWEILHKQLKQDANKNKHPKSLWGFVNDQQNNKGK